MAKEKTCRNCGEPLRPRRREWWERNGYGRFVTPRKWCSHVCREAWYADHGYWWAAVNVVWRRAGRETFGGAACEKCGRSRKGQLEVHHIVHLDGDRDLNPLNIPSNLVLLCRECHGCAHRGWPSPLDDGLLAERPGLFQATMFAIAGAAS